MKTLISSLVALLLCSPAFSAEETDAQKSKRIEAAVKVIKRLSQSDKVYKVTPDQSIKDSLFEIAEQEQLDSEDFANSYTTDSTEVWEVDSLKWGSETMKGAYSYIFNFDFNEVSHQDDDDQEDHAKIKELIDDAKLAFKDLVNSGVQFGVGPTGAVQCGVRFQALYIINKYNGKVHEIVLEGSGC